MSKEKIQQLYDLASTDPDLQKKLQAIGPTDPAADKISELARSRGIDLSAAELRATVKDAKALSDEDLERVAGGVITGGTTVTSGAIYMINTSNTSGPISATFTSAFNYIK